MFGLVCYAEYDLTNLSTLEGWPVTVTVVDICWGTFLCATTAVASVFLHRFVSVLEALRRRETPRPLPSLRDNRVESVEILESSLDTLKKLHVGSISIRQGDSRGLKKGIVINVQVLLHSVSRAFHQGWNIIFSEPLGRDGISK
jgi:Predicted membrane protein (DUF2177)